MPTKVEKLADGVTLKSKHNWKRILDMWLKSDLKLSALDFAKLHKIPYGTLRDKELVVDGKKVKPFQAKFRKAYQASASAGRSNIRKLLRDCKAPRGKHYIKALEQGRMLLEHLMIESAEGFDIMSNAPFAYTSAGEAARISIQAASAYRELCLDLQGTSLNETLSWTLLPPELLPERSYSYRPSSAASAAARPAAARRSSACWRGSIAAPRAASLRRHIACSRTAPSSCFSRS